MAIKNYNKAFFHDKYQTEGLLPEEIGCEICTIMSGVPLDRHHIIFKSEAGWHEEINNVLNIIQVCRDCHHKFHAKQISREDLIDARGLRDLFDMDFHD
jgi:hypothetical protein